MTRSSPRHRARHSEHGSATLQVLFVAVLLFTAFAVAILWSAISTARHKLTAAADLTALSAAQALNTASIGAGERSVGTPRALSTSDPSGALGVLGVPGPPGAEACVVAARVTEANGVRLVGCEVVAEAVTVEVSLEVDLRVGRPALTARARAGPV